MTRDTAFGIEVGYLEMDDHPLLGRRNLVNVALVLWVPIPAIVCASWLFGWFPGDAIPADPGLGWPTSADQAAALLLHHPIVAANLFFFVFVDVQFWLIALVQRSSWLIDPYWTLIPPLLAIFYFVNPLAHPDTARAVLSFGLLLVWSIRLTWNYFRRERGRFGYREDWRYAKMRRERRFFAIEQIFVVYAAQHAMLVGLTLPFFAIAFVDAPFGVLDAICLGLATTGLAVAHVADNQLDRFMRENEARTSRGEAKIPVLDSGIWRFSRHPNYFGEQLFWWSIAGFGVVCGVAWGVVGAAINSCGLAVVTVMTERRMRAIPERRVAFEAYRARTSVWIPWPVRTRSGGGD